MKLVRVDADVVVMEVRGDHDTYEVELYRQDPWTFAVSSWSCSCPWGDWAFKRQVTFVGRFCSHALAALFETQSQENRKDSPLYRWNEEDTFRPYWAPQPEKPKRPKQPRRKRRSAAKGEAPYGVIFDGQDKVFVGVNHLVKLKFSDEMLDRIIEIGDEHGFWYEGVGGDVEPNEELFGDESAYEGSWDDAYVESIEDTPSEFFLLFGNVKENEIVDKLVSPGTTIFQSVLDGYEEDGERKRLYYLPDVVPDEDLLTEYLESISDGERDFVEMSQQEATRENVQEFCDAGEEACWEDWENPHTPAALVTKSANDRRDRYLLDADPGVYFTGSGHLLTLLQADENLELVGGEDIDR